MAITTFLEMTNLLLRGEAPTTETATVIGVVDGRPVKNTSYTGFPRTELDLPDDDYASYRTRAKTACTDDGVKPMTAEELEYERGLSKVLMTKFAKAIFSMDFTRFSFPVGYSEQRSFLERTADLFAFIADVYAEDMVDCGVAETRLNYLATGIIAGFHVYLAGKKPWNPVLGETFVGRWPNGVTMYGEQTSHHPPISDFQIFGPDNSWKCHAHCNFSISSGIRQVDVIQQGVFHLEFEDGTVYEWQFPTISVLGIIQGERYVLVKGPLVVEDKTNELTVTVNIAPKADKKKGIVKQRQTTVHGGILDGTGKEYCSTISGDYCKSVTVDGQIMWDIDQNIAHRPLEPVGDDELLPSDCRFRIDRMFLIKGQMEAADDGKAVIENAQRREEKLRKGAPLQ